MLAALAQMVACLPLGSAGPGFDPRQGGKFSTSELGGVEMYTFKSLDCTSQAWIKFQTLPHYKC